MLSILNPLFGQSPPEQPRSLVSARRHQFKSTYTTRNPTNLKTVVSGSQG